MPRVSWRRFLFRHVHGQFHELPERGDRLALPGNGSLLATSEERKEFWKQTARRAVEMAKADGPLPRDIVTRDAIDNAFAIDMAMGGSSNTVLHTLGHRPGSGRGV